PRRPGGAAPRRRPLPGLHVRARGERRRGRTLLARRARPPADPDRAERARAERARAGRRALAWSPVRVLLISTYELGHQPLHLASPAAALCRAGHEGRCLDLSVQPWDPGALEWTQAVGFSVPMHTAMRLALSAGRRVRREHPGLPICFY